MATTLPQVPSKIQVVDAHGYMSMAWSKWFVQLFNRVGGPSSPTLSDLSSGQVSDFTSLSAAVIALQNGGGGLGVGPDL